MNQVRETNRAVSPDALLELVDELVGELHPRDAVRASLDSVLDKELGIDSLGRAELLQRIERRFGLSLPEQVLSDAETPRDLLREARSAAQASAGALPSDLEVLPVDGVRERPRRANTLVDVIDWHVRAHADRTHIYLYGEGDRPRPISYRSLYDGARAVAGGLREQGLEPGFSASIMLPTSEGYFASFLGILLAGGVPVPIYPPARPSQLEDHLRRHSGILANARARLLITVPEALGVARLLKTRVEGLRRVATVAELSAHGAGEELPVPRSRDIAFLQYTSGSTGNPKGVQLTHANLLANIRAMGAATKVQPEDVFVSWLPLYHDMGLIGAWLGSLYYAIPLVLMSPLAFLARPSRWLWAIHNHRGTLSAAPNFAYELSLAKVRDEEIAGLDLSSWRLAFNGAEPVSPQTIRHFGERFRAFGFRREAMAPVYGLAESSVGLAFPPPGRGPVIDRVDRRSLERSGEAVPAAPPDEEALEFVGCGKPIPGHEVRVVDAQGRDQPDRREGRLQFRGPSSTSGYFNNPEATRGLFDGDWLETGDLAYLADGELYLTSRVKDVIIRAGRNVYPYELEEAVGDLEGIRKGCVAVFGSREAASGTERLVVLAETREEEKAALDLLRERILSVATELLGAPPDEILLAPPHTVLKTSSGKIRRAACRELYETGGLGRGERRVWIQLLRLALSGIPPALRKSWRSFKESAYAGYCWFLFGLLAPVVWLLAAVLPRRSWRWVVIRKAARLLLFLTGVPLTVEGIEHLPAGQSCILAVNHASYLDGLLLVAGLPVDLGFVAKGEFRGNFIAGLFLRRIGSTFVDRLDSRRGVEDVRQLAGTARSGRAIVFFPEGTFHRMPGLLKFRMGAFVLAAEVGLPVLPVTIRGARSLLRGDTWFPRRSQIRILVGGPVVPAGSDWEAAVELRDCVREEILRHCGESDLAQR